MSINLPLQGRRRTASDRVREAVGDGGEAIARAAGDAIEAGAARARAGAEATAATSRRLIGRVREAREARRRSAPRGGRAASCAAGAALGVAGAYLLDPAKGSQRRRVARDRLLATARRGGAAAVRGAQYRRGQIQGLVHRLGGSGRDAGQELNDAALAEKVRSEVLRPEDAPKGDVNINVERGTVYLRGQVDAQEQIEQLVAASSAVDGVTGVESLLHLPDTPAPAKGEGVRVSP